MHTYKKNNLSRVLWFMTMLIVVVSQSCTSDEEVIFDKYWNFPSHITVNVDEEFRVLVSKGGSDELVIPAAAQNYSLDVANNRVVNQLQSNYFKGISIGATNINILSSDRKLIASVKVTVKSPFSSTPGQGNSLVVRDKQEIKYAVKTSIFEGKKDETIFSKYTFQSSDSSIVEINSDGTMTGRKVGTVKITIKSRTSGAVLKVVEVTVLPNEVFDMKSGEALGISDVNYYYESSSDAKVAAIIYQSKLQAKKPGTAYIYGYSGSKDLCWQVNVAEGSLKSLFTLNMPKSSILDSKDIIKAMGDRNYKTYESLIYGNNDYEALEYAPFDDAKSITFYFSKGPIYKGELQFAIIDTGKKSVDVLGWLYTNHTEAFDKWTYNMYFVCNGIWNYIPTNGSWSEIKVSLKTIY